MTSVTAARYAPIRRHLILCCLSLPGGTRSRRITSAGGRMAGNQRDVVEILRYELNFLEQGEFARAIGEGRASSPFQDTMSCLNYGEPLRPHACHECLLYEYVPEHARTEEIPCHHIPLEPAGRTIADFLKNKDAV